MYTRHCYQTFKQNFGHFLFTFQRQMLYCYGLWCFFKQKKLPIKENTWPKGQQTKENGSQPFQRL